MLPICLNQLATPLLTLVELRQGVASGLGLHLFQRDGVLHIASHSQQDVEALFQSQLKLEHTVSRLGLHQGTIQVQRDLVLVGIDLDLGGVPCPLCIAAASDVHHGLGAPICLVDIEAVLAGLAVHGDQALIVAAAHAALVAGCAAKVEHIPHMGSPQPGTILKHLCHMLMIQGLILLGVVLH